MKDQLVSLETAKLAKEKGFDILCIMWNDDPKCDIRSVTWTIPTQSLLQKWLREKHGIHITITLYGKEGKMYFADVYRTMDELIYLTINRLGSTLDDTYGNVYEELLERSLFKALNLIE